MKLQPAVVATVGGAVGASLLWYLQGPGRSLSSAFQDLGGLLGSIRLTAAQLNMVDIIGREARAAGLGWLTDAAVVNAYAESRLDPAAVSGFEGEDSVGLFQLNSARGAAGQGMSTAARKNPNINAARIFEIAQGADGAQLRRARGSTNAELAVIFARDIERCYKCGHGGGSSELDSRRALASKLLGDRAEVRP